MQRRLLIQAFIAGVVRARINAGTVATAIPTATTIATRIIEFLDMCVCKPNAERSCAGPMTSGKADRGLPASAAVTG